MLEHFLNYFLGILKGYFSCVKISLNFVSGTLKSISYMLKIF